MRVLGLSILLALAACRADPSPEPRPERVASACRGERFEEARFIVCDPGTGTITLIAAGKDEAPVRSFAEAAAKIEAADVLFAMNAGMFDEEGRPIGLAVVDGVEKHAINLKRGFGNFHLKPNGVFLIDSAGKPAVLESSKAAALKETPRFATQSGPMLLVRGALHPRIEQDGPSRLVRNGVGVTADGRALFVLSEDLVSFGKFARFFRDRLKTPDALFLDGSVSSLWDPGANRQDSFAPLGPMIVAVRRAASAPGRGAPARP